MKKVVSYKVVAHITKVVWSISGGCLALLLLNNFNLLHYGREYIHFYPAILALIFLLAAIVSWSISLFVRNTFQPFFFKSRIIEVFRLYLTISFIAIHGMYFYEKGLIDLYSELSLFTDYIFTIALLVSLVAAYAVWVYFGVLFKLIYKLSLFIRFTKNEKLLIFAYVIVNITSIAFTNFFTSLYYQTDKVFSLDSGSQLESNILSNTYSMYTGIRHVGESIITSPIGALSKSFGDLAWFIPNGQHLISIVFFNVLIVLSAIMLVRMLELKDRIYQVAFYVLYLLSFPVQLFSIMFEQYVPSVFFLILFVFIIWATCEKRPKIDYGAISNRWLESLKIITLVASGMGVLTSFFAAILLVGRNIKASFKNIIMILGVISVFVITTGQVLTVVFAYQEYNQLKTFMSLSYGDRLEMYSHFVVNSITNLTTYFGPLGFTSGNGVMDSIQTMQSPSIIGVILFVTATAGVVIGIKNKQILSYASALWVLLSFIVLVLFGWGAANNEMTLYTYYFSFAFIVGIFNSLIWAIEELKKRGMTTRQSIIVLLTPIILVSSFNIVLRIEITKYGTSHYPVVIEEFIKNENASH